MTLALGLAAVFVGAAMSLAGYTKRPLGRLLFGFWDAPGSSSADVGPAELPPAPANAATGGVHAPSQPNPRAGGHPGERPS